MNVIHTLCELSLNVLRKDHGSCVWEDENMHLVCVRVLDDIAYTSSFSREEFIDSLPEEP